MAGGFQSQTINWVGVHQITWSQCKWAESTFRKGNPGHFANQGKFTYWVEIRQHLTGLFVSRCCYYQGTSSVSATGAETWTLLYREEECEFN